MIRRLMQHVKRLTCVSLLRYQVSVLQVGQRPRSPRGFFYLRF